MKKIKGITLILLICSVLFMLSGCKSMGTFKSSFTGNEISIVAENAAVESRTSGNFTVPEGEDVVADFELNDDASIQIVMRYKNEPNKPISEPPNEAFTVTGSGSMYFEVEPGEYTVSATTASKVTGTVTISTAPHIEQELTAIDDTGEEHAADQQEQQEDFLSPDKDRLSAAEWDYSKITSKSLDEIESFALMVKNLYLNKNWAYLSALIEYPILINEQDSIASPTDFITYMENTTIDIDSVNAMEDELCENMLYTAEAIRLGTGQIWFAEFENEEAEPDIEETTSEFKVVAINGIIPVEAETK